MGNSKNLEHIVIELIDTKKNEYNRTDVNLQGNMHGLEFLLDLALSSPLFIVI